MKRLLLILLLLPLFATAKTKELVIDDYQALKQYYKQQKHPAQTLFVFDIDDTLLTSTDALGSTAFWDWQVSLLHHHPHERKLFAPTLIELSDIEGFLLSKAHMVETDSHLSTLLKLASSRNSAMISLTARSPDFYQTTVKQLSRPSFEGRDGQVYFDMQGVAVKNRTSISHSFKCPGFKRPVIYKHGVMFVSGQNKGVALACLLNRAHKHYQSIIFVDDSIKNINDVERIFANDKRTLLTAIVYTREHAKESRFLHSKRLKALAYKKWQHLKQAFKKYKAISSG